ncbi:MAG TPA: phytanoyl-CoA dioxygenase family protein [Pyrinomonadaceae bacterium]|nr:phytanoyl-CoA dioxygenase family protein [Pyrinomonadaceae bacterium]
MIDVGEYRRQGFALCKGFFAAEEIAQIHSEAKEVFAMQMRRHGLLPAGDVSDAEFNAGMFNLFEIDLPSIITCGKHAQHLISLHRLSLDDRIITALKGLGLSFPNISTRPTLYFNHPRLAQKEVFWRLWLHQDWRAMQGSLDSVVVWVPLVDIDKSLGALEIVPGSHRWGLLAAEMVDGVGDIAPEAASRIDPASLLTVEVERGDALFFSTLLVHRSGTNVTESLRWSCHFRYNNLFEKTFIERGYPHPYIYKPQNELISPGFPAVAEVNKIFCPEDNEG